MCFEKVFRFKMMTEKVLQVFEKRRVSPILSEKQLILDETWFMWILIEAQCTDCMWGWCDPSSTILGQKFQFTSWVGGSERKQWREEMSSNSIQKRSAADTEFSKLCVMKVGQTLPVLFKFYKKWLAKLERGSRRLDLINHWETSH